MQRPRFSKGEVEPVVQRPVFRRASVVGVVGASMLVAIAAFADTPTRAPTHDTQAKRAGAEANGKKRAELDARMKALRADVLRKRVGLEPQKAAEVERILERHSPERRKLQAKLRTHRHALQQLLEQDSADQQAYTRALQGLRETEGELQKLRQREMDELAKQLTPKQQAKLVVALRELHKGLRRHLRDYRQR